MEGNTEEGPCFNDDRDIIANKYPKADSYTKPYEQIGRNGKMKLRSN